MRDSKPVIIETMDNNGSLGYMYNDISNGSNKIFEHNCCYIYKIYESIGREEIIKTLNDSNDIDKIYGCGFFFKLKGDNNIYTLLNNAYGCAGTGLRDSDNDMYDVWEKTVYSLEEKHTLSSLTGTTVWQIFDTYSYRPGLGLKTYIISNDKKSIYITGKVTSGVNYSPVEVVKLTSDSSARSTDVCYIVNTTSTIKKCGDMEYGGFVYLLENGDLYFYGESDDNFITNANGVVVDVNTKLSSDVQDIWVMANICIYKKNNLYYFFGYTRDGHSKYPIGEDGAPGTKYPFPGVQLTYLPFSIPGAIKNIYPLRYGVGVLLTNGNLYITGKNEQFGITEEKCKLESENVKDVLLTDGYNIVYRNNDLGYRSSVGEELNKYIIYRAHRYYPSIALL